MATMKNDRIILSYVACSCTKCLTGRLRFIFIISDIKY